MVQRTPSDHTEKQDPSNASQMVTTYQRESVKSTHFSGPHRKCGRLIHVSHFSGPHRKCGRRIFISAGVRSLIQTLHCIPATISLKQHPFSCTFKDSIPYDRPAAQAYALQDRCLVAFGVPWGRPSELSDAFCKHLQFLVHFLECPLIKARPRRQLLLQRPRIRRLVAFRAPDRTPTLGGRLWHAICGPGEP